MWILIGPFAGFAMLTTNWEVAFGLQSNLFDFLAFHCSIKLGSRNVFKMYKVSYILMNVFGHVLHMEIEDLLAFCPTLGSD